MSVGQGLGGVVGTVLGAVLAAPTGGLSVAAGAALGFQTGMAIGGLLDPPKGPTVHGPRLSDLAVQTSTYGNFIPRVYGTIGIHGNILWLENNRLKETVRKQKQGGKGGGSKTTVKTYSYSATFILALCQGPIAGIRRIWCMDKLIYNAGSDDLETIIASNQAAAGWKLYLGTDDQMPDPRYEADVGVGNASAFRGLAYLAFYDFQLADYSNTLQAAQFKVEVVSSLSGSDSLMFSYVGAVPAISLASPRPSNVYGPNLEAYFSTFNSAGGSDGGLYAFNRHGARRTIDYQSESSPLIPGGNFRPGGTLSSDTLEGWFFEDSGYRDHMFIRRGGRTKYYQCSLVGQLPSSIIERSGVFWLIYDVAGSNSLSRLLFTDGGTEVDGQIVAAATVSGWSGYCLAGRNDGQLARCSFSMIFPAASATVSISLHDELFATTQSDSFVISRPANTTGADYFSVFSFGYVSDDGIMYVVFGQAPGAGGGEDGRFFYFAFDTLARRLVSDTQALYHPSKVDFEPWLVAVKNGIMQVGDANGSDLSCSVVAYGIGIQGNQTAPLSSIVGAEAGLSALIGQADIDVSAITSEVRGYRVSGGTIRSAIEPLQGAFPFDVIQSGYQIKCVPRGQASTVTIPWEDLGATDGDEPGDILRQSREMDSQLPARTTIKYLDAAREYATGEQYAERINTEAINRADRELPLVLTADEAAGVAEVLQGLAWLERADLSITLPPTYLHLEGADVVTVATPQAAYQLRLTEINYTPDGRLECKAKPSRAALYTPNATGGEGVAPIGTVPLAGESIFLPLDIPVVDETLQNDVGFVGVMTGTTDSWPGALLVRSNDDGQTWADLQGFTGRTPIGTARDTLPASSCTLIDQRTITVDLISGELESVTRDHMLSGVNYAAYGVDGRWEIVRFQDAALQGDGSYLASGFVRGERGTEWATGLHAAGDYFVLLDDPDNAFIGSPVESIGLERLYRGVTSGASVDDASDVSFAYQGVNLECLSPVYAMGSRDGSGNFTGTFTRRSRLSSSWWTTGVEAPLGETAQAYEIDAMNGSAVVRTIAASTPTFSYSAANQATDFGSAQASITFRIYQLSAVVGRGYPLEVTL